ncbi:MAG: plasmid recombination protein, partial [Marinospirillum sp.]|uniref:plasmid recombination protein n=1 Tax=Marinospirillum sp. TaxID=2183934 RepID=UPI0019FD3BDB
VIAEGLRDETHIGHLRQQPDIQVFTNPDSPVVHPSQLGPWIHKMMDGCRYGQSDRFPTGRPLRKNAVALGTLVASLPQMTKDVSKDMVMDFRQRSQNWFNQWLEERSMLLHASILHLDEEHPHVHGWFTPSLELIERGEWPLGKITFPHRSVLRSMQTDFFEAVGRHFYQDRVKPESSRRKRLDRRTAIQLRDMPEALTRHPIFDMGFYQCALALASLADQRGQQEQQIAMDLLKELLDMEAGITNREILDQIMAEQRKLYAEQRRDKGISSESRQK